MAGILGTRGTVMMDVVFMAMLLIVPVLWTSIYLAHSRRLYRGHQVIQLVLATVLLLAVIAFELEVRLVGWRPLAEASPFWRDGSLNDWIDWSLAVHLCFAVPTPLLWAVVIFQALRGFASPPAPGPHSAFHRRWGTIAAVGMTMTAITGWVFYWLAFVAK